MSMAKQNSSNLFHCLLTDQFRLFFGMTHLLRYPTALSCTLCQAHYVNRWCTDTFNSCSAFCGQFFKVVMINDITPVLAWYICYVIAIIGMVPIEEKATSINKLVITFSDFNHNFSIILQNQGIKVDHHFFSQANIACSALQCAY